MSIREKQIYITFKTTKRLGWVRELWKEKETAETGRILTVDEIADRLLNEKIEADYPAMPTLEKRLDALEGQLVSELLNPPNEEP